MMHALVPNHRTLFWNFNEKFPPFLFPQVELFSAERLPKADTLAEKYLTEKWLEFPFKSPWKLSTNQTWKNFFLFWSPLSTPSCWSNSVPVSFTYFSSFFFVFFFIREKIIVSTKNWEFIFVVLNESVLELSQQILIFMMPKKVPGLILAKTSTLTQLPSHLTCRWKFEHLWKNWL